MSRNLIIVGAVAAAIVASKLLFENVFGIGLEPVATAWLDEAGIGSALVIVALLAADVFLPVPSSLVMVLSGAAFGVAGGSLLALAGSLLGEWLGFELARRYGHQLSSRLVGDDELRRLRSFFERYGASAILISRPLPIVMETMSIVAGLSHMRRRVFLLASLAGTAPIVLVYAYAGAVSREAGSFVPAVVILIAVTGAGWLWYRAQSTRHDAPRSGQATHPGVSPPPPSSATSPD